MRALGTLGSVLKFVTLMVAIVVVQGILAYRFTFFTYIDLPLIYTVYHGFIMSRPGESALIGTVLGLMQDSLSGSPLGTNGFSKSLLGFLAASAGSKFNVDQAFTRGLALFLFTLADGLVVTILGLSIGSSTLGYDGGVATALLSGVFNASVGLIMFGYRDRFNHATA
jgi:rod shape-determining protein MreD